MTTPPLPESSCVRVRLDYQSPAGTLAGSRFYLGYTGGAPSAANCVTLATDIAAQWESHLANLCTTDWSLVEVDVLDIATDSGASGNWTGSNAGLISGSPLPDQIASNCEFEIARRYRGGKPRMFIPPATASQLNDQNNWTPAFASDIATQVGSFFAGIEALSIGSMGTLSHVNLSYYQGFTNVTNSSGRTRAAPKYRTSAKVDTVTGYLGKQRLASQKRRRTASTY